MRHSGAWFVRFLLFLACNSTDPAVPSWQEVGLPVLTGVSNVQLAFGGAIPVVAGMEAGVLVIRRGIGGGWEDLSSNVLPAASPAWRLAALPDGSPLLLASDPAAGYRAVFWQYTNGGWSNHGVLSAGAAHDPALRVQGGIFAACSDAGHGFRVRVLRLEGGLWIDTGEVSAGDGSAIALGGDAGGLLVAWADWTLTGSPVVSRFAAGWSVLGGGACAGGWSEGLQVAAAPDGSTLVLFREAGLTNRVLVFSGSAWEDAAPAGFPAQGACALAAAGGTPRLAWLGSGGELLLGERTGTGWQASPGIALSNTNAVISLAVDAAGHPGVLLESAAGLRLYRYR